MLNDNTENPSVTFLGLLNPIVLKIELYPTAMTIMDSKAYFGLVVNQNSKNRMLANRRIGYPNPKKEKNHVVLGLTYGDRYANNRAITAMILRP